MSTASTRPLSSRSLLRRFRPYHQKELKIRWQPPSLRPRSSSRCLASSRTRRLQFAASLSQLCCTYTSSSGWCDIGCAELTETVALENSPYTAADAPERKLFLRDSHIEQIATMCADIEVGNPSFPCLEGHARLTVGRFPTAHRARRPVRVDQPLEPARGRTATRQDPRLPRRTRPHDHRACSPAPSPLGRSS